MTLKLRSLASPALGLVAASCPSFALAQKTAPSSVTPPTLRPPDASSAARIEIPEADGLVPPPGAEQLAVKVQRVVVEGGFPEVEDATRAIVAPLERRRVTLAQVYAAASQIEAIHARAGYVLARVAVPPQSLVDGGTLRIVVIDGFVEDVDTSGVPARARRAVASRVGGLIGKRHLRLPQIEQALLIAGDVPGVQMTSTLTRGTQAGGARVLLQATQHPVSGSLGADNALAASLGTYAVNGQLSLNSVLGFGEQIYGFVSSGYEVNRLATSGVPVRVLGGGIAIPLARGRASINPEATFSRTQPAPGVGVPPSRGDLRRLTMRGSYILERTRRRSLVVNATVEQIDETNEFLGFTLISHDRFLAARLGLTYSGVSAGNQSYYAVAQLSQGLGNLAALRLSDLPSGTGFSRQGSALDFTKLNLVARATTPLARRFEVTLIAKGQTTFGKPVFRSEQTALEGADALSGFVGGATAIDTALTVRTEIARPIVLAAPVRLQLVPYAFVASGIGRAELPTALEPASIRAASLGAGARATLPRIGLSFAAEYARNYADVAGLGPDDRVNVSATLRF